MTRPQASAIHHTYLVLPPTTMKRPSFWLDVKKSKSDFLNFQPYTLNTHILYQGICMPNLSFISLHVGLHIGHSTCPNVALPNKALCTDCYHYLPILNGTLQTKHPKLFQYELSHTLHTLASSSEYRYLYFYHHHDAIRCRLHSVEQPKIEKV